MLSVPIVFWMEVFRSPLNPLVLLEIVLRANPLYLLPKMNLT